MSVVSESLQQLLIDHTQLQHQLAEQDPAHVLKTALEHGQAKLDALFNEHQETRVYELVHARAWMVDQVLRLAWQQLEYMSLRSTLDH